MEYRYTPDLVVRRHQDLEELAALPAVYLAPAGTPATVQRAQGAFLVRDLGADPPTAWEFPEPEIVGLQIEVRILAELWSDVERLGQALTRWITTRPDGAPGLGLGRDLVSPETGQPVRVQSLALPVESAPSLAAGVAEARAVWLLTFGRWTAHTVTAAPLVRETGATVTATARES